MKRVPEGFEWPLHIVWRGYHNPYNKIDCTYCGRTGYSQDLLEVQKVAFQIPETIIGLQWITQIYAKKEYYKIFEQNTERFIENCGEDSATCTLCEGKGYFFCSEEIKKLHTEWTPVEPPEGEGWQLWETTSAGSPISPVFNSLDDLCAWAEVNTTAFGNIKTSKEDWKKLLTDGVWKFPTQAVNPATGEVINAVFM